MKIIVEFEDKEEAELYLSGPQAWGKLDDIYQKVRGYLKHCEPNLESAVALLEEVRGMSYED